MRGKKVVFVVAGVAAVLAAAALYVAVSWDPEPAAGPGSQQTEGEAGGDAAADGTRTGQRERREGASTVEGEPGNLLSADQHDFSGSIEGWTPQGNTTLAHVVEPAATGEGALAITVDASGPYPDGTRTARAGTTQTGSRAVPAEPGATYRARWRILPAGEPAQARCELRWFDASERILDTVAGPAVTAEPGTWTGAECEATAPPRAAVVVLRVHLDGVDYGQTYYVDDAWLTSPATTGPSDEATPTAPPVVRAPGQDVDASNTGPTAYSDPDLGRLLTYDDLTPSGSVTTTHDGQVIERLDISGGIVIAHDDVTIRAVRIRSGDETYSISYAPGTEVSGADISYVEIDGGDNPDQIGVHLWDFELRHAHVHGQATGINFGSNSTIEHSYVHSQALKPGSHNAAMSLHGGSGVRVRFNNLEGSTSSALSLYPRLSPITDVLVEGNLFNGGSYCAYAGDSHNYAEQNEGIRFVGNVFGTKFYPDCGIHGPYSSWDPTRPGNEWSGNAYEDGRPLG